MSSYWAPKDVSDAEWLEILAKQIPGEDTAHLKFSWSLWRDQIAPRLRTVAASLASQHPCGGPPTSSNPYGCYYEVCAAMKKAESRPWTPAPCTCDTASPLKCQSPGPLHKPIDKAGISPMTSLYGSIRLSMQGAKPVACGCGFACAKAEGRPMAAGCYCRAHR